MITVPAVVPWGFAGVGVVTVTFMVACGDCLSYNNMTCPATDDPYNPVFYEADICSRYYRCFNGSAIIQTCPDGLDWNPSKKICDYPWEAGCASSTLPTNVNLDDICPPGLPPACLPADKSIIQNDTHPGDCKWYYTCNSHAEAYCGKCQDGLYYNPNTEVCDTEGLNWCKITTNEPATMESTATQPSITTSTIVSSTTEAATGTITTEAATATTTTEPPATISTTTNTTTTELPTTVSTTTKIPTIASTITTERLTTAPTSTELPTTVSTTNKIPTTATTITTERLTTAPTSTTELPTTESTTTNIPTTASTTTTERFTTASTTTELPTTASTTTEIPTTPFTATDYQTNAPSTTDATEHPVKPATTSSTAVPPITPPTTSHPECPGGTEPGHPNCPICLCDGTKFKHPFECDWYYECYENVPILKQCPGGFHWNDKFQICDYPCLAGCERE